MIPLVALVVGALLGLVLQPTVPAFLAPYLPVAVVAALDAIFGGIRARLDGTFSDRVFLGDQLGVGSELSTAVVVVLGVRMFQNLAEVRRQLFQA